MIDNRLEQFISYIKAIYGDNGQSGVKEKKAPPCCYTFESRTKERIDKPYFDDCDWQNFWKITKTYFPLHSVCGNNYMNSVEKIKDKEIAFFKNKIENKLGKHFFKKEKNVLEIGYGFGAVGHYLIDNYKTNYYGIDYVSSDKNDNDYFYLAKKRFYEIQNSGIPNELKSIKYDFVFSTNVFQHLTQKQRFDYIKEVYDVLNKNGVFYFDVFQYNGKKDGFAEQYPNDNYSTCFFNTYTKIDTSEEIETYLKKCNFKFDRKIEGVVDSYTNGISYTCVKK